MTEGPSVTAAAARGPKDASRAETQDPAGAPQAGGPAEQAPGSSTAVRQPGHPGLAAQAITGARRARATVGQAAAGETAAGETAADRAQASPEDEEIEPHVRVDARL